MWVYDLNIGLSLLVCFLLAGAIGSEWALLRWPWKFVLVMSAFEHAVLAYANFEAKSAAVDVQLRLYLLAITLAGVAAALATVAVVAITQRVGAAVTPADRRTLEA